MNNRVGEVNCNSKGERFVISKYRDTNDIDVVFEVDNSVKNTTYAQFKTGHVSRKGTEKTDFWIGEIVEDDMGEECKIVEVNSDESVTVQYSDGDIVSELTLKSVMVGAFTREGECFGYHKTRAGIDTERRNTYTNVVYMVNRFRRCVMIRPCGFGKTKIGLKLFSSPRYRRCLFLHPSSDDTNADIINKSQSVKKIDTRTYAWLRRLSDDQIKNLNYDIVFCDEVHCIGGDEDENGRHLGAYHTYKAMKTFMESHPQTHFVGATATPLRMDGINVIENMFHNHVCYPYTDEDAFEDGIFKNPNYYYCVYDVQKRLAEEIEKKINIKMNRDDLKKAIGLSNDDIDEIDTRYMDKHIKKTCSEIFPNKNRLSFIAFYLTNQEIENNRDKILGWFRSAYPNYEIKDITVTNRTNKSLTDVTNLITESITPGYEGRIDVIFNCEMLCMSFHSELISGLILDRKTQSLAKYMQMIGRILSCDDDNPVIIFDIVDNIHSDFVCKMPRQENKKPTTPKFDTQNQTFADIVTMYPRARHWDEIKKINKKAKKSEELLIANEILNGESIEEQVIKDSSIEPILETKETITKSTKEAIEEAQNMIKEQNMSVMDAFNLLAGIQDEYGTLDPEAEEKIEDAEVILSHTYSGLNITSIPKTSPIEHKANDDTDNTVPTTPAAPIKVAENKEEKDTLGFDNTYYIDHNTGDLYSKHINVLNKRSNFEEDVLAAIQKIKKGTLDAIINKWHTYPQCEDNYESYEEIDKKTLKYKFLKSCSEFIFGVNIENTLVYMIEGKVA